MVFLDTCKKNVPLFLLALGLMSCRSAITLSSTKDNIRNTLLKEGGVFAVAFKDLATGKELLINGDEEFHAASTMKTPVLVEVFKQAVAGKFSLHDSMCSGFGYFSHDEGNARIIFIESYLLNKPR